MGRDTNGAILVSGHAAECGRHVEGAAFAIAVYHVDKPGAAPFAASADARYYRENRRRAFAADLYIESSREAVCLVAGPSARVSCALLTVDNGEVTMTSLSTNDAAVSGLVRFGAQDPAGPVTPTPACLTCF